MLLFRNNNWQCSGLCVIQIHRDKPLLVNTVSHIDADTSCSCSCSYSCSPLHTVFVVLLLMITNTLQRTSVCPSVCLNHQEWNRNSCPSPTSS